MNIKELLKKEADERYREFTSSLIPNINNVLGVRTPFLRKLSKKLAKENNYQDILKSKKFEYMEEYMLKGMIIGLLNKPIEEVLGYTTEFISQINNWAVCDSFCCSLKITKSNLKVVWDFIQPFFKSNQEYNLRFAYVMLLNYYVQDKYIDEVLKLIDEFNDDRYYSQMAVAWLVSICYIKYPEKTEKYLKFSKLNKWTYNKSIQKICESLKIDKTTKQRLKLLRK